jgi:hypothetical protein
MSILLFKLSTVKSSSINVNNQIQKLKNKQKSIKNPDPGVEFRKQPKSRIKICQLKNLEMFG